MSFIVKLKPLSVIKADLGIQPDGPTHAFLTETCAKHMDKYVPYREGHLAKYRLEGNNKIFYDEAYAHYMYEGKVMGPNVPIKNEDGIITGWFSPTKPKYYTGKDIKYNISPGHEYAGPHWDERMWTAEKNEVLKEVKEYISRGAK